MPRTKKSSRLKVKLVPVRNARKPGMRRAVVDSGVARRADDDTWSVGYLTSDNEEEERQNYKLMVIPVAPIVSIAAAPRTTTKRKPRSRRGRRDS